MKQNNDETDDCQQNIQENKNGVDSVDEGNSRLILRLMMSVVNN